MEPTNVLVRCGGAGVVDGRWIQVQLGKNIAFDVRRGHMGCTKSWFTEPIETFYTFARYSPDHVPQRSAYSSYYLQQQPTHTGHRAHWLQQFYLLEQLPMAGNARHTSIHFRCFILSRCPHWPYDTLLFSLFCFFSSVSSSFSEIVSGEHEP